MRFKWDHLRPPSNTTDLTLRQTIYSKYKFSKRIRINNLWVTQIYVRLIIFTCWTSIICLVSEIKMISVIQTVSVGWVSSTFTHEFEVVKEIYFFQRGRSSLRDNDHFHICINLLFIGAIIFLVLALLRQSFWEESNHNISLY